VFTESKQVDFILETEQPVFDMKGHLVTSVLQKDDRVLGIALVHKRKAFDCTLNKGVNDDWEEQSGCKCTTSQIETSIYARGTTAHQFI